MKTAEDLKNEFENETGYSYTFGDGTKYTLWLESKLSHSQPPGNKTAEDNAYLEKAAKEYGSKVVKGHKEWIQDGIGDKATGFIAGAKWAMQHYSQQGMDENAIDKSELKDFLYWVFHKADRIYVEHTLGWRDKAIEELYAAFKRLGNDLQK